MKATHHPYTGISARPGRAATFSRLHWLNASARRKRLARLSVLIGGHDNAATDAVPADADLRGPGSETIPQILLIDRDMAAALTLGCLLVREARVTYAPTVADARAALKRDLYSLIVIDPDLPDADLDGVLRLSAGTPLLVYAAEQPRWHAPVKHFLPKPWTSPRQLWTTISSLLGNSQLHSAGD